MGLAIGLQMLPDPVGGIGIERRRRLVQQQQFGLVDQRLCQRHAGLLPGGELAIGAVEEVAEIEIGGELLDALAQIGHRIEPAEDRQVLPHREPHRHVDIGAFEIHPAEHARRFARASMQPSTWMRPEVGSTSPMIMAIVVVLPAPLPPSSPVMLPRAMRNETSSTARVVL